MTYKDKVIADLQEKCEFFKNDYVVIIEKGEAYEIIRSFFDGDGKSFGEELERLKEDQINFWGGQWSDKGLSWAGLKDGDMVIEFKTVNDRIMFKMKYGV